MTNFRPGALQTLSLASPLFLGIMVFSLLYIGDASFSYVCSETYIIRQGQRVDLTPWILAPMVGERLFTRSYALLIIQAMQIIFIAGGCMLFLHKIPPKNRKATAFMLGAILSTLLSFGLIFVFGALRFGYQADVMAGDLWTFFSIATGSGCYVMASIFERPGLKERLADLAFVLLLSTFSIGWSAFLHYMGGGC